jgi:shikimate kinase
MTRIYLIGMPGSGKSTSGKRFAKALGWSYADLDKLIAIRAGKSISDIFATEGEATFRQYELNALHETAGSIRIVIGCGGGTAAWHNNIDWMLNNGMVIWLNIPENELLQRLLRSKHSRPMFPNRQADDILHRLRVLFNQRQVYYEKATLQVNSERALLDLVPVLKASH